MSKLVELRLDGDLKIKGFRATLAIRDEAARIAWEEITESLPANPNLAALVEKHWRQEYRSLAIPSRHKQEIVFPSLHSFLQSGMEKPATSEDFAWRVKLVKTDIRSSVKKCQESAAQVTLAMNAWLKSPEFREIDTRLRERLNVDEDIRVLIRTEDWHLQALPWQLWDLFKSFPQAEPSLSQFNFTRPEFLPKPARKRQVKILAILGDSHGINVAEDRKVLDNLSSTAEVTFLVEPQRQEITDELWEKSWDIIFFAGHGETEGNTGKIYINPHDCLTIDELWLGLRKAVNKGLQLAIFNCCDGLGLATKLDDFQMIPQMILMRDLVPDFVAQQFLKNFLTEFVAGKPLYVAAREARQRLEILEDRFPCASWLPVIWQHPAAVPPVWSDFLIEPDAPKIIEDIPPVSASPQKQPVRVFSGLVSVILASAVCTWAVMGARYFGTIEPSELAAFDRLMSQREPELIDDRLLVVEVTDRDVEQYNYPQNDEILARAIDKLQQFQPLAIGLNMHRYSPREPGRQELINLFEKHPNIITVCSYNYGKLFEPPPELLPDKLTNQVGFSNLPQDEAPDNKGSSIRRQPLSYHPKLSNFNNNCKSPISFSLLLAKRFLEERGFTSYITNNEEWVIGSVRFKRLTARTGGYQKLEPLVSQILLNYRANPQPAFQVTLQEVLEGQINSDLVKGKIVLIGHTSEASRDESDTPYGKMSGVWIHAHMVSQILSTTIDKRPLLWVLPQWQGLQWGDAIVVWLAALTGGLLAWRSRSLLVLAIAGSIAIFVLDRGALVILTFGGWMPLVPAVLALVSTACIWFIYDRSRSA